MIICVVIPFFVAEVERQLNPALAGELLVLSDNTRTVRRVVAVSKQAAQLEIQPGIVLRHAQAFVPELQVAPLNPLIAFLDIGALKPRGLYELGHLLQKSLELHGLVSQIAIAPNRFTAWVTAQATRECTVSFVNEGEEAYALTCHPVSLLPLEEKVLQRLDWLGIRTLGDFARLPSASIRPQFGKLGQLAYRLAKGMDATPIPKLMQMREFTRMLKFDGEVMDGQVIDSGLNKLAAEVATSLERAAKTARKLRLTLDLNSRGACELEVRLRRRSNTAPQLHNALKVALDRAKIAVPVAGITVAAGDIVPLAAQQLELFPAMRVVETREAVLEDLVERYGPRFFKATIVDSASLLPEEQAEFNLVEIAG